VVAKSTGSSLYWPSTGRVRGCGPTLALDLGEATAFWLDQRSVLQSRLEGPQSAVSNGIRRPCVSDSTIGTALMADNLACSADLVALRQAAECHGYLIQPATAFTVSCAAMRFTTSTGRLTVQ
jgi:hypothetical protein